MPLFRKIRNWLARVTGKESLYARIQGKELLKHEAREHILDILKREPGLSFQEIQDRVGLAPGTTKWHLDKLQRSSFLTSHKDGRHRRFFPTGMGTRTVKAITAVRDPSRLAIARMVQRNPGISQGDLATAAGLAQSTVAHHMDRFLDDGIIRKEKDGRTARYYIHGHYTKAVKAAVGYVL